MTIKSTLLPISVVLIVSVSLANGIRYSSSPSEPFVQVLENAAIGTLLKTYAVYDGAGNINVELVNNQDIVKIQQIGTGRNVTVRVYTNGALDRDYTTGTKTIEMRARNNVGDSASFSFTLIINDVNDVHPMFKGQPYVVDIPENETLHSIVYNMIHAEDPDLGQGGVVRYSMIPKTQSSEREVEYSSTFSMDSISGQVILTKSLDYESNNFYQFMVLATDGGGLNSTTDFIIHVLDRQDTPPVFERIQYRVNIPESKGIGSQVIDVRARDGDTGSSNSILYNFTSCSQCFGMFAINETTGSITVSGTVDRDSGEVKERDGICILKVQATEGNEFSQMPGANFTALADVAVVIEDLDDNDPIFNLIFYNASIAENTARTMPITLDNVISVFDKDQGENSRMTIFLQYPDRTNCTDFRVSPSSIQSSGQINILVNNPGLLDYEVIQLIELKIIAVETKNSSHRADADLRIHITDINDNSPIFNASSFTVNIPENFRNNTVLTSVIATDADRDSNNNEITYTLVGDGGGRFAVDEKTGAIRTICQHMNCTEELDREIIPSFYVTIKATDNGQRANVALLVVNLLDENDNSPKFEQTTYSVSVNENVCGRNLSLIISATDRDVGRNHEITYEISPDNTELANNFTINSTTGELNLVGCLDYDRIPGEDNGVIKLIVLGKDNGNEQRVTPVNVTVYVLNENQPQERNRTDSELYQAQIEMFKAKTQLSLAQADFFQQARMTSLAKEKYFLAATKKLEDGASFHSVDFVSALSET